MFIREACALLRLAPLSPLAGAVLAGARVLPALHDIRAKMTHPHVVAAWSDEDLPLEVTLTFCLQAVSGAAVTTVTTGATIASGAMVVLCCQD